MKLSLVALGGHKADASATILVFENDSYGGVASVHWEMQVIPYQPTVGCDAPYDIATACSFNQPSGSCSAGGYAWHQDGWGDPQAAGCDNGNLHGYIETPSGETLDVVTDSRCSAYLCCSGAGQRFGWQCHV